MHAVVYGTPVGRVGNYALCPVWRSIAIITWRGYRNANTARPKSAFDSDVTWSSVRELRDELMVAEQTRDAIESLIILNWPRHV